MKSRNFILIYCFFALLGVKPACAQAAWSPDADRPHNHFAGGYMWQSPTKAWNASAARTKAAGGELRIPVILGQFSDVAFFYDRENFVNMLTKEGYAEFEATGSARDYFQAQFGVPVTIDVYGPVTVSKERAYYGNDNKERKDEHAGTFIAEACIAAAGEVDFAKYDMDGDGYVDNVFVFFAGEDQAQAGKEHPEYIWSHSYNLLHSDYGNVLELSGVKLNNYSCSAELFRVPQGTGFDSRMAPIGTFCHEYLHNLGLPDMYDSDYELSGGISAGMWGKTALMDAGNANNHGNTPPNLNAVEKECLGIMEPQDLSAGDYTMYPQGSGKEQSYRIANPLDKNEYYLFEARQMKGWDSYIGLTEEKALGMLVYHVDKSAGNSSNSESFGNITSADRWMRYNEVNARPDFQCADLVEADGRKDINPSDSQKNNLEGIFFPTLGVSAIGSSSKMPLTFRDGNVSKFGILNIRTDEGAIKFTVINADSPLPPSPIEPPKDDSFLYIVVQHKPSGGIILSVNNSFQASVEWFYDGSPIAADGSFVPSKNGMIQARISWPDGTVDNLYKRQTIKK